MRVRRTPAEGERWHDVTRRDARSRGFWIAAIVGVLVPVVGDGGLVTNLRSGVIVKRRAPGSFWLRVSVLALLAMPFAVRIRRHETRKELANASRRTVCPTCGTTAEGNDGATCRCGGRFVPAGTMRWVEDTPT